MNRTSKRTLLVIVCILFVNAKITKKTFPYFAFYGADPPLEILNKPINLCGFDNKPSTKSCCSCHNVCVKLNNCCVDKFWAAFQYTKKRKHDQQKPLPNIKTTSKHEADNVHKQILDYFEYFVQMTTAQQNTSSKRYQCNPVFGEDLLNKIKDSHSEKYSMISECAKDSKSPQNSSPSMAGKDGKTEDEDYETCMSSSYTSMLDSLPVLSLPEKDSKDEAAYDLYRSASCARCNNVKSYIPMNITLECRGSNKHNLRALGVQKCIFKLGTQLDVFKCTYDRRPYDNAATKCSDSVLEKQCKAYIDPYADAPNVHCYKCKNHQTSLSSTKDEFKVDLNTFKQSCLPADKVIVINFVPWSMTLDFSGKTESCKSGKIYDSFTKECRQLECSTSFNATATDNCNTKTERSIDNDLYETTEYYQKIEAKITYACTGVGLIGYCILITTYLRFERLRNLSGLNALAMSFCLLATDVLMLTADNTSKLWCKIAAISIHYFVLVSQLWATIICLDLAIAMHSSVSTASRNKVKTFKKYTVAAFLFPLIFIGIPLLLNETGYIIVGYTENCWMSDFLVRLSSYIIPIGVSYVVSFTALAFTFCKIRATERETKKALESNRTHVGILRIALKLVVGLGVIDAMGFVQFPGSQLVEYNMVLTLVTATLRSLKGVFVCLLYLANRKVWGLYRGTMSRSVSNKYGTTSKSSWRSNTAASSTTSTF